MHHNLSFLIVRSPEGFSSEGLGEIEQIAASQGRGVTQLMEQVLAPLAEKLQENEAENDSTSDEEEKDEWDHAHNNKTYCTYKYNII